MENNLPLVYSTHAQQKCKVFTDRSHVGFSTLVAPINKNGATKNQNVGAEPTAQHVSKLLGGCYAKAKMAPSLCHCIRGLLERQKIKSEDISL